MKILQLGKAYPPANLGGVEITIQLITEGLHSKGIYCDVLGVNDTKESVIDRGPYGVIYREALIKKMFSTLLSIRLISRLFKIHKEYDIIHIHHPDPMSALALYLVRPSCKIIIHWHSDILRQKTLLKLYKPIQNWLLKRADAIIATSDDYVKGSASLTENNHKVFIIPIGIDKNNLVFDKKAVQELRNRFEGKKLILTIGRMSYYKGYDYLIDSVQYLNDDSLLLIIGTGELETHLKNRVRELKLEDKVVFLGKVNDLERNSFLYACDLFVLSSVFKTEAFAIVQVEAMALGKPVVSTEIPGSGVQWVNKNQVSGITVPIKDSKLIGEAINKIVSDSALQEKLSKGALNRFETEFTQERMTERIIKLYHQLLDLETQDV